ncbi:hypothetical protein Tco_1377491 [Tanacetum coccineum]
MRSTFHLLNDKQTLRWDKGGLFLVYAHGRVLSRNLHNQQHQAPPPVVEPFNLEEPLENPPPVAPMDDQRTMAQLLEAPTAGYEDAIVVPEITTTNIDAYARE